MKFKFSQVSKRLSFLDFIIQNPQNDLTFVIKDVQTGEKLSILWTCSSPRVFFTLRAESLALGSGYHSSWIM